MHHRENRGHREKREDDCGDSLSVSSEFSVVETPGECRRHTLLFMQCRGEYHRVVTDPLKLDSARRRIAGNWW